MAEMQFPRSPCYVCQKPIGLKEGLIYCNDFAGNICDILEYVNVEELLNAEHSTFVNQVTKAYFKQFEDVFRTRRTEGTDQDFIRDALIDNGAHKYRLEKILGTRPDKWLAILSHHDCIPKFSTEGYPINLDRINTAERALAWTVHLNDKKWFNARGWNFILEDLFGRIPV